MTAEVEEAFGKMLEHQSKTGQVARRKVIG